MQVYSEPWWQEKRERLGFGQMKRHVFLCADPTKAKCCDREAGLQAWQYLVTRLRELGLGRPRSQRMAGRVHGGRPCADCCSSAGMGCRLAGGRPLRDRLALGAGNAVLRAAYHGYRRFS